MATRYYTDQDVRKVFEAVLREHSQADICRETGARPQHVSQMARGAPIQGKVLAWLGFERVTGLYRQAQKGK